MTSHQAPTETTLETSEKSKHPLLQNVKTSTVVGILLFLVLSPIVKLSLREFFKTNHINNQVKELLQIPVFSALKNADPTVYGQIEQDITKSLRADEPAENQKKIITIALGQAFPKYATQASDDALINWTKTFQQAVLQDPQACKAQFGTGTTNVDSPASQAFLSATGTVIESGTSSQKPAPIDPDQVKQSLTTVKAKIAAIHGDSITLLADNKKMNQDAPKTCAILNDFYAEIAKLPKPEGGAILRTILGKQAQ
jgi:hypothetical protein